MCVNCNSCFIFQHIFSTSGDLQGIYCSTVYRPLTTWRPSMKVYPSLRKALSPSTHLLQLWPQTDTCLLVLRAKIFSKMNVYISADFDILRHLPYLILNSSHGKLYYNLPVCARVCVGPCAHLRACAFACMCVMCCFCIFHKNIWGKKLSRNSQSKTQSQELTFLSQL